MGDNCAGVKKEDLLNHMAKDLCCHTPQHVGASKWQVKKGQRESARSPYCKPAEKKKEKKTKCKGRTSKAKCIGSEGMNGKCTWKKNGKCVFLCKNAHKAANCMKNCVWKNG